MREPGVVRPLCDVSRLAPTSNKMRLVQQAPRLSCEDLLQNKWKKSGVVGPLLESHMNFRNSMGFCAAVQPYDPYEKLTLPHG